MAAMGTRTSFLFAQMLQQADETGLSSSKPIANELTYELPAKASHVARVSLYW